VKKILFIFLASLCFLAAAYLIYLNKTVLPYKIKSALIAGLEDSTGKHVAIDSAKIDILRGLVIKGLKISDDTAEIISAKDISCRFLIIPVFKKEVVVTAMKLDSPQILVERMRDNSINIVELFFKKPIALMDGKFNLTISRIMISNGEIIFKDDTFEEPFTKDIKNVNIDVRFFPHKVGFSTDFQIPSQITMLVKSSGEYRFLEKELFIKVDAKDFYPKDFTVYYGEEKFKIPDGRIDISATLNYKDGILDVDTQISGMDMKFSDSKIEANLNSAIKAKIKYNTSNKELIYTGTAVVNNLALYNLDALDKIYDIRGDISFSDKVFAFNNITATVLGLPIKARAEIPNLKNPILKIDIATSAKLKVLKDILTNKFNIEMPLDMDGFSSLNITLLYKNFTAEQPELKGSIDINNAIFKSEYIKNMFEDVSGRFNFTQNQLIFKNVEFRYNNTDYKVSGTITNFKAPGVQLDLNSNQLSAKTLFSVNEKTIILSSLTGHYGDYGFSIQGDVDTTDPKDLKADLKGSLKFELAENKEPYKNFKDKFKDLKLSGSIKADFAVKGGLNDIPKSVIEAQIKCDKLHVNSFKFSNFVLNFTHRNSISNIKYMRASLYGGSFKGNGLVDLASKDASYQINGDMKGVRIEELKKDTIFKDKDISGIIQTHFGIKGFAKDPSRFNAWGKLSISKGKLWQLNLLRGIGTLFFRSDFNSVLFEEGSCDFFIKNKSFFTNDLIMKSSLINLYGSVKITFDKMIEASLKAEFTDEGVDAARADNIAGAIERYSIIEVKGTLDEPKYELRPDF
jgi:hypothetical protein